MVKFIGSVTTAAGLPHGSDVLLLANLISCFAEKPLQSNLCSQLDLSSVLIFFLLLLLTVMNSSVTKCYSQHSSHVTESVV